MRSSTLHPDEGAARAMNYGEWVWVAEEASDIAARLYVVFSHFFGETAFLSAFSPYWANQREILRARWDAIAANRAPRVFGRDSFLRDAGIERERFVREVEESVMRFLRSGGAGTQEVLSLFRQREAYIGFLEKAVAYHADYSDEQIATVAQAEWIREVQSKPRLRAEFSPQEMRRHAAECIVAEDVPEARRRCTYDLGAMYEEAERKWVLQGTTSAERARLWHDLLDRYFAL